MAILIVHEGADWNAEQYDQAMERLIPDPSDPPEGMVSTYGAPRESGGWRVVDVWDSQADWERFRDETLGPIMQDMQAPPFTSEITEVHKAIVRDQVSA